MIRSFFFGCTDLGYVFTGYHCIWSGFICMFWQCTVFETIWNSCTIAFSRYLLLLEQEKRVKLLAVHMDSHVDMCVEWWIWTSRSGEPSFGPRPRLSTRHTQFHQHFTNSHKIAIYHQSHKAELPWRILSTWHQRQQLLPRSKHPQSQVSPHKSRPTSHLSFQATWDLIPVQNSPKTSRT